jgi:hypothetical protein
MYKTPHTISNVVAQDSLLKFPVGLPIKTCGYKDNYFKVNINGQEGYVFCMCVTTPKRMREIREQLLFKISKQLHKLPTFEILNIILIGQDEQIIILNMQEYASTHSNTSLLTKIIIFYFNSYFN